MRHHFFKRTCIHNLRVSASFAKSRDCVPEGLVLPPEILIAGDIAPFERLVVTKIGGDNWKNRIYSFAIPGTRPGVVEARGSLAHLLSASDLCCIITTTQIGCDTSGGPERADLLDLRFHPHKSARADNDHSSLRIVHERGDFAHAIGSVDDTIRSRRARLPRYFLSSLVTGLRVDRVERMCVEMSAELPVSTMRQAGLWANQSVFVYNSSRGGISAESYVVPNRMNDDVVISGALSRVADLDDRISEAAFVLSNAKEGNPIIVRHSTDSGDHDND